MTTDSTAVAVRRPAGALAVTDGQVEWSETQRAALAQIGVGDAPLGDQLVLLHRAQTTGLDPFSRQIYMISRREKKDNQWVTKWTIQTGIDGFRVTARRGARREGESFTYEDPLWCGPDGQWSDVWLGDGPPRAAKFVVVKTDRQGRVERFTAVAKWESYVQTSSEGNPTGRWRSGGDQMLSKCAEALALRMAYPHDLSGVYTDDEMGQADNGRVIDQPAGPAVDPVEMAARREHYLALVAQSADVEAVRGIWRMAGEACQAREITPAVLNDVAEACKARGTELVDTTAAPDDTPPAEPTARLIISQDQSKRMHVLLTRHGVTIRDDKLNLLSRMVGRRLDSSADLSAAEADQVIDDLAGISGSFEAWRANLVAETEPAGEPA